MWKILTIASSLCGPKQALIGRSYLVISTTVSITDHIGITGRRRRTLAVLLAKSKGTFVS
jgi:hypothetical protein